MATTPKVPVRPYIRRKTTSVPVDPQELFRKALVGEKPLSPEEEIQRRSKRKVRFTGGEVTPTRKTLVKARKKDLKKAREALRRARLELKQLIAQSKAEIAEARAAVEAARVDVRDAKEALRIQKTL